MELQGRQGEFDEMGAQLVVLGSVPETMDEARSQARTRRITYPILYDSGTQVTRDLGMWSEHMQMPWMGYLIIDRSGRIAAGEQQISEAKGAGPENTERILSALDDVRQQAPVGARPQ